MSPYVFATKAAVQLNNVGIELLVQGCHRQAIETFQDAAKVALLSSDMARPVPHGKNSSWAEPGTWDDQNHLLQIEAMLHNSTKRLAEPNPTQGGQGIATNLTVISNDEDPVLIAFDAPSSTVTYLIRIKSIEDESAINDDVAVRAAVILYNYGTSYESLALNTSAPSPTQQQLQLGALQMFRLSLTTLLGERNTLEGLSWVQCGCLTFLPVLRQLLRVTRLLNMTSESKKYMVQLNYFRNLLQGLHQMKEMAAMQHARAA